MPLLPEKLRRVLERLVKDMRSNEDVYGIGLFGSWSRGEASPSSDVDLLIFGKANFGHEHVERVEVAGLLVDLDRVPKQWLQGPIPPEIDQKIHEMQILYDRDWSLADTKLLMAKSYSTPERINIRAESHIIDSDIYLSRATSAFSRNDFLSAHLFATIALENVLKILIEAAQLPFSNSRFVEKLEISATKIDMRTFFDEYLAIVGLDKITKEMAKEKLKLFKTIWDEVDSAVMQNPQKLASSHFKVRTALKYYLNPAFLQGAVMRTTDLINSEKLAESSHYLNAILLAVLENYVWLKTSANGLAIDYTMLLHSLERIGQKNSKNYGNVVKLLNLEGINKTIADGAIESTRKIMLEIRRERKVLIKNTVFKS